MFTGFDLSQLWDGLSIYPYLENALYVFLTLSVVQLGTWLVRRHLQQLAGRFSGKALTRLSIVAPSLIWVTGLVTIFTVLGGDLNSITEILLAGSLIIGLVITPAGSNMVAGFLNAWNDVFHIGDTISIMNEQIVGVVIAFGLMSTRIKTIDNSVYDIPNKLLFDEVVHNYCAVPFYRTPVLVHVDDPNASPREVIGLLQTLLQRDERWNKVDPETGEEYCAEVRLTEIGDSSMVYRAIGWIDDRLMAQKMQDILLETCVSALMDASISVGQTTNLSAVSGLRLQNTDSPLPFSTPSGSILLS